MKLSSRTGGVRDDALVNANAPEETGMSLPCAVQRMVAASLPNGTIKTDWMAGWMAGEIA